MDVDVLKDSDSDDGEANAPRRKYKPRAKASDFPERRFEGAGRGRGRPPNAGYGHPGGGHGGYGDSGYGVGPGSAQQLQQLQQALTVRMEPGLGAEAAPYTLTGGVPDWVDFDVQHEEDGTRTLEQILGRRKVDRRLANNGVALAGTKKTGLAVVPSPAKAAAAAAAAADDEDEDDDEEDEGAEDGEYYDVVKMRCVAL